LLFSLTGDDADLFSINENSGEVRFNSAPDFDAPADFDGDNVYDVTVHVKDAINDTSQAVAISVTNLVGETWVGGDEKQSRTGTIEEDNLSGGNARDALNGSLGNDTLTGGNGPDTFVFAAAFGNDAITDFKPHLDFIQLDPALFADFAAVQAHAADDGYGNAVITFDASNTITLLGVTTGQLHVSDFLFV